MDLHRLRLACMIGLPILLVISFVIKTLIAAPNDIWAFAFFTISLTANIGYFTNFIAIKMLFRPYQKTALGRQGLIPKNQSKLASALSTTLTEHFLQHDHLVDYLKSSNVLPQLVKSLEQTTSEWLASNQNQRVMQSFLIKLIREHQPEIEHWINQQQNAILERFSEQVDLNQLANDGFHWLDKAFKDNPRQMEFLIEPLVNTIAGNIPIIATRLLDLVDDHIEQQSTIKRGVAKAAKWSANLSEEDIKNYLFKMVASQTFRQTLIEGLQSLVADYQKLSNENSELAIAMERFSQNIKQSLSKKLDEIQLIDQIVDYVENPKSASLLGNASIKISSLVFNK